MMSEIWTNGDAIIWLSRKHCGKRRNCSLRAISSFPTMFSKVVCYWCVKMSIYGIKSIIILSSVSNGGRHFDPESWLLEHWIAKMDLLQFGEKHRNIAIWRFLFVWGFTLYHQYFGYLTATVHKSMFPWSSKPVVVLFP